MTDLDRDTRLQRNPGVVARPLAASEGGVLLHLESGAYHRFNPVGFATWELLEGVQTGAQLADALRARVVDAPPELERDVLGFLQAAVDRDLVRIVA